MTKSRHLPHVALSLVILALTGACSSAPTINGNKYEKDEILSTSGDKPMPEWAEKGEVEPFIIKAGKAYSVGISTLRGDDRPEAGLRVSENSARAAFSKAIENRTEFVFQNSEENSNYEATQAKWIGSEVSSLVTHSMVVEGNWYKRFLQSQEDGSRRIFIKCYSLLSLPEAELKQAVMAAVHKGEGQHRLSQGFQDQVAKQWSRFVEGNASSTEARMPANQTDAKDE